MRRQEVDALSELAEDFRRKALAATERGAENESKYRDVSGYDRCEGKAQAYTHCAEEVERLLRHLKAS